MSEVEAQKPALVIDLVGPEGNVFALVGKAWQTLEEAGQGEEARHCACGSGRCRPSAG